MAEVKNLKENETAEEKEEQKEKKVNKTRAEKKAEFAEKHPKLSKAPGALLSAGKKLLGGALVIGTGIAGAAAVLNTIGKPKVYVEIPGMKTETLDAKPGVDFVDVPKEEPKPETVTE